MAKLNKNEIIEIVSEKTFVTKKEVREIIDETLSLISLALESGNEVNLTNFGTFVPKKRAGKTITHPGTGLKIQSNDTNVVTFKMSKSFKDNLNQ
ncbi:MAG: HU family DNA-binding protein [Bacilli bacterium]|nr:HU family DNA-binding protein [Bacilli bacterium]